MNAPSPLRAKWAALNERERLGVTVAAAVVAVALLVGVAIRPAWQTLSQAPTRMATLDAELEALQRGVAEAQVLRQVPPVAPQQAQEALQAATRFLGEQAQLSVQGDRATLRVTQISGPALTRWLGEVRQGARASTLEAQLQRSGDGYTGTLVLQLGAGG